MFAMINGGLYNFNQKEKLKLLSLNVNFDQDSLATVIYYHEIVSLPNLYIVVDTSVEDMFNIVIKDDNKTLIFHPYSGGLYYYYTSNEARHVLELTHSKSTISSYSIVQIVRINTKFLIISKN